METREELTNCIMKMNIYVVSLTENIDKENIIFKLSIGRKTLILNKKCCYYSEIKKIFTMHYFI